MAGTTRFHIDAVFKALDKFSAPVARMTTSLQRFTRRVRKGMRGIGKMTRRMARGFKNSALTLGSLAVMGGFALKSLVGPATRFQHAMDGVNAVTLGAYKEHIPKLRKAALELGKKTTFTATQVANAMEVLAKSGLKADETLSLIEPTLLGAEAAGSDISTMADIMVSTIAQMERLTPKDGTKVIDAYAVAASSANTTLEELGEGMKKVIPIGEGLGFAFEDLLATTTLLQHMGIEASMSAAQQRTFFTRLTSLTPKAAKSFKGMGIEILDANKNMKQIPELLAAIAAGFAKVKGNAPQIRKMAEAVGLRGGIAGNILIRNMGQVEELLTKIGTLSGGAAGKMAEMRLDNLFGDLVRLKSAWEFFRIDIAQDTMPKFRERVQGLTDQLAGEGSEDRRKHWADTFNEAVEKLDAFWNQHGC
jgi:TP901 family phage tail tape measure protein